MADVDDRKTLIARLFGAAGKECRESVMDGYLEALKRMDTPRLFRVVDRVLDGIKDLTDPEDYKPPAPGALWKVARALRALPAPAPLELHGTRPQPQDQWDTAANTLLLNYVTAGLVEKAIRNSKPTRDASRYASHEATAVLLKWKSAWARDMREDRELYGGKLDGKLLWAQCMASAETEISGILRAEAA